MSVKNYQQSGTTLIELVIAVGIFSVLFTLTNLMLIDSWKNYFFLSNHQETVTTLTQATDRIAQTLATATALPLVVTIDSQTYTASPTTLIATLPSIDENGATTVGADTIVYTTSAEGLIELVQAGGGTRTDHSQIVVGPELLDVSFTLIQTSGSQIHPHLTTTLTIGTDLPQASTTQSLSRTVVLKNLP